MKHEALLIIPRRVSPAPGAWVVPGSPVVSSTAAGDEAAREALIERLRAERARPRLSVDHGRSDIAIVRDKSIRHPEGYRLRIRADGVRITAAAGAGAFYGVQTLCDLIAACDGSIPCRDIEDEPVLARRGYYLDCSRGRVPSVATVKQLADRLAAWKMNELQLYVENVFTFRRHPKIGEGFSPYTPDEIREMRDHCAGRCVRFVPSLTSLGHFEKILMIDEYAELGELPGFRDLPGGTTICPVDPRSIELVRDMFEEFLPLFDSDDFNACGDEPWELGQGRSKSEVERVGLGIVYLEWILKLRELCLRAGKRLNIWGDIVLLHPEIIPRIPTDVVLLNWDYAPDGKRVHRTSEFANAGHPLVCCPGTHGWRSHGTRLRQALANISQFAAVAAANGAEGLLNTDWGDGGHRNPLGVSMFAAAYGAAYSWNPGAAADVEDDEHLRRFAFHTYRDPGRAVEDAVATIGDARYGSWAYSAVLEKLSEPAGLGRGFCRARPAIADAPPDDGAVAEMLAATEAFRSPAPEPTLADFERLSLQEYALANRLNRLALLRLRIARAVRSGSSPARADVDAALSEGPDVRDDLARLWTARSRPSLLQDNLVGFDEAHADLEALRDRHAG